MKSKKIIIGSDHAGFELKEDIKKFLTQLGYDCEDIGVFNKEPADYPQTALKVAKKVVQTDSKGILMCGSGLGEAIVANKVKGIRAANCFNEYTAINSREHNNSNLLCLGARILKNDEAKKITKIWLSTNFSNEERHKRRVKQIKEIEEKICR
ncbi:MAG TPA: ribose 5-phosphate isomerase B [Candidatus Woesearchaeota archaeon]|jgi:ribose 5-phosphate isomerase B|nr:ribose 5-phosphate isomerase B [Candidatus Woesearchaeota archaeon]HJN56512.1 ribose 5-phosphate isomerase B [Candidatus Woesearchaeota archaeon]|tara:strand:+ start:4598 stop:5056 length:459 start_codon:yes stop_codon:yes gene_type:complete